MVTSDEPVASPVVRSLTFRVPGPPVGKGRPRFTTRGGKPSTFTPEKTVRFEQLVAFEAAAMWGAGGLMQGPVRLVVRAFFLMPKSMQKKAPVASCPKTGRPDADNLLKSVSDALNGVVYADDAQVVEATVTKAYAAQGDAARTEVSVQELGAAGEVGVGVP